jgi:hypothetical protein
MPQRLSEEVVRALLAEKNWEPVEGWKYVNSATPIPGRCLVEGCGYEGPGPRYARLQQGVGACKRCGERKPSEETVRTLLAEKDWEPIMGWEYVDNHTPIPGRCLVEGCGYEGPGPRYNSLQQGQGACKRCSGAEKIPEEVVRALLAEKNWEPVEGWGYLNKNTPIPGRCLICGYKSGSDKGPTYGSLKHGGNGACQSCAEFGYDPEKPGSFYRFEFSDKGVTFLCYGISNIVDERRKHYEGKLDVQNFQFLYFEDGSIPQQIEKQFHEIRKESSAPASTCGVRGTITESFPISNIELSTCFVAHWASAVATSRTASAFSRAWGAQASDLLTSVR